MELAEALRLYAEWWVLTFRYMMLETERDMFDAKVVQHMADIYGAGWFMRRTDEDNATLCLLEAELKQEEANELARTGHDYFGS